MDLCFLQINRANSQDLDSRHLDAVLQRVKSESGDFWSIKTIMEGMVYMVLIDYKTGFKRNTKWSVEHCLLLGEVWKWWLRETFIYNKASWRKDSISSLRVFGAFWCCKFTYTWQILLRYTVHPRKLTWNWKITISTRRYIFIHGYFSIVIFVFGVLGVVYIPWIQRR